MLGILANGAYLSAMKLVLVILCIGAAAFLLRVLTALVQESRFPAPRAVRAYHAKFQPRGKRGELIEMPPDVVVRSVTRKTGKRIALGLLVILGLANAGPIITIFFKF